MSNKIELKSISELSGMKFFIPDYQRGYRWTKQQVKDLLDDIEEFIQKKQGGFYSIQPLVVKKTITNKDEFLNELNQLKGKDQLLSSANEILNKYTKWEVIDGQQRLTTIYVVYAYLNASKKLEELYELEYETRTDSKEFLKNIDSEKKEDNIDFYYISEAYEQINAWFEGKDEIKNEFLKTLLYNVKFIWYESIDEDPIKVFTRLNVGKIPLTNAELIKALFLNKSNFEGYDYKKIRLQQQEIASEWDNIEYTLQDDEFWLFLNEVNYDKPTRIDFIFDLICDENILKLDNSENYIGTDEYRTFRYFYKWFKEQKEIDISICWKEVKAIFQTFLEWFNDLELYHYVGFLVEHKTRILSVLGKWMELETKDIFITDYIIPEIKDKIKNCSNLDKLYEVSGAPKTQVHPLLLLHNIQTVINQNKSLIETEKYRLPIFYKFPFHLFKKEQWDVEHIDSHTENTLENEKDQKEWLKATLIAITDKNLKDKIKDFLQKDQEETNESEFQNIFKDINDNSNKLKDDEKDKVWNFTLLDASTNRSYGNSIFAVKRRVIIGKDQGKIITVNDNLEIEEKDGAIAFIPPCTRNVFMKYYNASSNNLREWSIDDAEAYKNNIAIVLKDFFKTDNTKKDEQ